MYMWIKGSRGEQIVPISPGTFSRMSPEKVDYCFWTLEQAVKAREEHIKMLKIKAEQEASHYQATLDSFK